MKDINKVILLGRLGNDPIQRQTKSGSSVVHFSLATTRRYSKEDKGNPAETSQVEETQWHNIVCWGKLGEACAAYLKKGAPIYLDGNIRYKQYEDKTGQMKFSVEIYADTVSFLGNGGAKRTTEQEALKSKEMENLTSEDRPQIRSENSPEVRPTETYSPVAINAELDALFRD